MTAPASPVAPPLPGAGAAADQVDYVSGRTRVYGIVGHPIEQVRSPEMVTAELRARGLDAVLVPMHVLPEDFEDAMPRLMRVRNLDGFVFTIPYKARACALAARLGPHARAVGAINALARAADGGWVGEAFDGIGCVEAFRRRGLSFAGSRVMLVGAGGAGSAVGVAIARERPASMRIHDVDGERARSLAARIAGVDASIAVECSAPSVAGVDFVLNVTPAGMLGDASLPVPAAELEPTTVVFDAVVKPELTPLLAAARGRGCAVVFGREMMRGQISRIVDFFVAPRG